MAAQLENLAATLQTLASQLQAGGAVQSQGLPVQQSLGWADGAQLPQAQADFSAAAAGVADMMGMPPSNGLPTGVPLTGRVKAWYEDKGYGFLTLDNGGPDVFVHQKQLSDGQYLVKGSSVSFEAQFVPVRNKYVATRCEGAVNPAGVGVGTMGYQNGGGFGKGYEKGYGKGYGKDEFDPNPSDNMFVAGLPLGTDQEAIRRIFSQFGVVKQCLVLNASPGKTDVAALVRMEDLQQAKWLVENLNGNIPQGMSTPITVRYASNRAEKARAFEGGGYGKSFGKGSGGKDRFNPYETMARAPTTDSSLMTSVLAQALSQVSQPAQGRAVDATASPMSNALNLLNGAQATNPLSSMLMQQSQGMAPQQQDPNAILQALQGLQSLAGLFGAASGGNAMPGGTAGLLGLATGGNTMPGAMDGLLGLATGGNTMPGATDGLLGLANTTPDATSGTGDVVDGANLGE